MPVQVRIFIVRHGETEWNRLRRIQGQLDVQLNETGLMQAMLVGEALKHIPFARAFSSDLQRASKTAECILQYHPNIVLERDASIRERVSNPPLAEPPIINTQQPPCSIWVNYRGTFHIPKDQRLRWRRTGGVMQHPRNILIVSHGAWISVLLSALRANGLVTCRRGVEIGNCLNTGVSIVEYSRLSSGGDGALVGTLVQFSGAEHLIRQDLHIQTVNADVSYSRERTR
ncbi:histidine phosphatase superfamily [Chiua virens]|nr:histidine phosphatase superfamily [Chiua virens]